MDIIDHASIMLFMHIMYDPWNPRIPQGSPVFLCRWPKTQTAVPRADPTGLPRRPASPVLPRRWRRTPLLPMFILTLS